MNFIPILCIVHERECLQKSGLFDKTLRTHEDWDLLFQEAFLHLKLSTRIDPSNPEGWALLSMAAKETGDTVTAAEASSKAGSLDVKR